MKSLYISLVSSQRLIEELKNESGVNPGYAGQKFNRLIIEGMNKNGVYCETLTSIPVNSKISKRLFWYEHKECEGGISYNYIPFLNIPYVHNVCLIIYSFLYVIFWGFKNKGSKFIMMDVLNVSICLGALIASKIMRIHSVGIVTDIPGLMVDASIDNSKEKGYLKLTNLYKYLSYYNSYVFLTEQMNSLINKKSKPFIVMEGLSDIAIRPVLMRNEDSIRSVLYAGGLHKRYGLEKLVLAFMKTQDPQYRLIIYGSGPFVRDLIKYSLEDPRIQFRGVASNAKVLEAERNATLLVNPRPTFEEFTKYSFPSKNLEYMSIGRPVLTTKLPGMPTEYYQYVYLLEDETIDGYRTKIESILSKPSAELDEMGFKAQKWVFENKNNIFQTQRILSLVKGNV